MNSLLVLLLSSLIMGIAGWVVNSSISKYNMFLLIICCYLVGVILGFSLKG